MASNRLAATPPMVRGLPVLGNTIDALRDVCGLLAQAYHLHGPVFRLSRLGREATVLAGIKANQFCAFLDQRVRSPRRLVQVAE